VLGELANSQDLAAFVLRSRLLADFQARFARLRTLEAKQQEPLLKELVNKYAVHQPQGVELDKHAGEDGRRLWSDADLALAHLRVDIRFGSRPGATMSVVGDDANRVVAERLAHAHKIRDYYRDYAEIRERLRLLAVTWLVESLAERSVPLQQLDPAFREAVNVETNGLAIGLFVLDTNRSLHWNYWRSGAERVRNPSMPEHQVTTLRGSASGAKRVMDSPRPLFLASSIDQYNMSVARLRVEENLCVKTHWQAHEKLVEQLETEAASLRNRVKNFGLKGGGILEEQAMIEKAYLDFRFDGEWKQAQSIVSVFDSVEQLLKTSPEVDSPCP
jgi:hypothetical protein